MEEDLAWFPVSGARKHEMDLGSEILVKRLLGLLLRGEL
jgi:hypothetical protein